METDKLYGLHFQKNSMFKGMGMVEEDDDNREAANERHSPFSLS